jgi:hypothetical protein
MDAVTKDLGNKLRVFKQKTCSVFQTRELRREFDTWVRKQHKKAQHLGTKTSNTAPALNSNPPVELSTHRSSHTSVTHGSGKSQATGARLARTLNLNTYKFHALGDYTSIIRKYGTTDSYSTESVHVRHPIGTTPHD